MFLLSSSAGKKTILHRKEPIALLNLQESRSRSRPYHEGLEQSRKKNAKLLEVMAHAMYSHLMEQQSEWVALGLL
jgi:hypothetical protein